jgi:hypothetical protein
MASRGKEETLTSSNAEQKNSSTQINKMGILRREIILPARCVTRRHSMLSL